jgi:hypothetical protein
MSMAPLTRVRWRVDALGPAIVRFGVGATGLSPRRAVSLARLRRRARGEPALRDRLEASWRERGLVGAALVWAWRSPGKQAEVLHATDPLVVVNVLARARGNVLLAGAELALEVPFLARELASDDPRLVSWARSTGVVQEVT